MSQEQIEIIEIEPYKLDSEFMVSFDYIEENKSWLMILGNLGIQVDTKEIDEYFFSAVDHENIYKSSLEKKRSALFNALVEQNKQIWNLYSDNIKNPI